MVVVAAAAFDADLFGHGDLDVVDVAAVPERLVNRVGKPEVHQVLDGLLAEVMVDAENVLFCKGALQVAVQLPGAFRSVPNGFSTISRWRLPSGLLASPAAARFCADGPKNSGEVAR